MSEIERIIFHMQGRPSDQMAALRDAGCLPGPDDATPEETLKRKLHLSRTGCWCGERRKPCEYHAGMEEGFDQALTARVVRGVGEQVAVPREVLEQVREALDPWGTTEARLLAALAALSTYMGKSE